jgi:hypothetical protein
VCFIQPREKGTPITGPLPQEKNIYLSRDFNKGESNCTAGAGWIDCWGGTVTQRGSPRSLQKEKLSAYLEWFVEYSELLQAVMKNIT